MCVIRTVRQFFCSFFVLKGLKAILNISYLFSIRASLFLCTTCCRVRELGFAIATPHPIWHLSVQKLTCLLFGLLLSANYISTCTIICKVDREQSLYLCNISKSFIYKKFQSVKPESLQYLESRSKASQEISREVVSERRRRPR